MTSECVMPPVLFPPMGRLIEALEAEGLEYARADDGALLLVWRNGDVAVEYVGLSDGIRVMGRWAVRLGTDSYRALVQDCNEWNSTRLLPKAFVSMPDVGADDEGVSVFGTIMFPVVDGNGLHDAFLSALAAVEEFLTWLSGRFAPDGDGGKEPTGE